MPSGRAACLTRSFLPSKPVTAVQGLNDQLLAFQRASGQQHGAGAMGSQGPSAGFGMGCLQSPDELKQARTRPYSEGSTWFACLRWACRHLMDAMPCSDTAALAAQIVEQASRAHLSSGSLTLTSDFLAPPLAW